MSVQQRNRLDFRLISGTKPWCSANKGERRIKDGTEASGEGIWADQQRNGIQIRAGRRESQEVKDEGNKMLV